MAKMKYIKPKEIQKRIHKVHEDTIQVGYTGYEASPIRKEGDTWTDKDGKEWEVKNGIIQSIPKFQDVRVPMFCPKCGGIMGKKQHDTRIYYKFGFCFDCLMDRDEEMVRQGTFKSYEEKYMMDKQRGYFEDKKKEIEEYLESLEGKKYLEYVNEEGKMEKWDGDLDKVRDFWKKELDFINEQLEKIYEKIGRTKTEKNDQGNDSK